ncbi:NAD(P)H-hydrate dehydratase [Aliihoeflea aestuarii]|nr:NAD(P)H-hydrate dehydratase [Aliihoeflea aestuarii]
MIERNAQYLGIKDSLDELLTSAEMAAVDRAAASDDPAGTYGLMQRAGEAVLRAALASFPDSNGADILCGPGNNGGDGYVVARLLAESGWVVRVWALGKPAPMSDARRAFDECRLKPLPLEDFRPTVEALVIDAVFGAGLSRNLPLSAAEAATRVAKADVKVLAVDLPSGVAGDSGADLGGAFDATETVTFARMKPGHLLYPGRALCGRVTLADIGIADRHVAAAGCRTWCNTPSLWRHRLPRPASDAHKYRRGHILVLSGPRYQTGAARLSAMSAARSGAGAVTLGSPPDALDVNAAHLTSIMLVVTESDADLTTFLRGRQPTACVIGPGFGTGDRTRTFVATLLGHEKTMSVILDADAITSFKDTPDVLFGMIGKSRSATILTPHEGEFRRLFPDMEHERSKLERARKAAARAGGIVIYKGPDTIIAAPDGRAAINGNGTPWLATAGSGDVLAGIVAALAGQGMPAFEAACAAVWLHAEAGGKFGPGLIAEDLPELLPAILRDLL